MGRIHRFVDEKQHGPRPGAPELRPGEATEAPGRESFLGHFTRELRNQARGKPTKEDRDLTKR
ncbi:hypothetical protein IMZ48_28410 [Candidatus Bathyarchaeota archaeon]|nr:hypothetical protein [Candidatus Bathyarchaeota archaeon]